MANIQRIKSISEFHRTRSLPEPDHPLISVVNYAEVKFLSRNRDTSWVLDFYLISIKRNIDGKIRYGQLQYDFDEGVMFFIAPDQVFSIESEMATSPTRSGWMLLIHPDFLWNTALATQIRRYEFFDYNVNEALFLSKKEENAMLGLVEHIRQEYHANIDQFSQGIIISYIETLLRYGERFYQRQFVTRKISNHQILHRLENILNNYFRSDELINKGIPTVSYVSEQLNLSPSYLSNVLKLLTGQSTQHHIHTKLIEMAKEKLSTTTLSVSEVAYALGFDYPQTFSKLFKAKTKQSPLAFRKAFN